MLALDTLRGFSEVGLVKSHSKDTSHFKECPVSYQWFIEKMCGEKAFEGSTETWNLSQRHTVSISQYLYGVPDWCLQSVCKSAFDFDVLLGST